VVACKLHSTQPATNRVRLIAAVTSLDTAQPKTIRIANTSTIPCIVNEWILQDIRRPEHSIILASDRRRGQGVAPAAGRHCLEYPVPVPQSCPYPQIILRPRSLASTLLLPLIPLPITCICTWCPCLPSQCPVNFGRCWEQFGRSLRSPAMVDQMRPQVA